MGMSSNEPVDDSLVPIIRRHAREAPEREALVFLDRGEHPADTASYGSLDADACRIAGELLHRALNGQAVLLAMPPGLDFTRVFLGCLYAGVIPVPVPYLIRGKGMHRIHAIAVDASPRAIITSTDGLADRALQAAVPGWYRRVAPIDAAELLAGPPTTLDWQPASSDIAFIQYTSGATSTPKGVVVSHANLLANQRMIQAGFAHNASCIGVNWLPHHHDMGLIGCILQPLYLGGRSILMSPLAFLQKPAKWLRAVAEYRATTAGGPNFGYELCIRQIRDDQIEGVDLAGWRLAFCGSEPIRPATLDSFVHRFRRFGFDPNALYPCYGLAEATLFVTGGTAGSGVTTRTIARSGIRDSAETAGERASVSCGHPAPDTAIAIVDPDTGAQADPGQLGEICVSGPQVSPGFWSGKRCETTEDPSRLLTINDRRYLRSGDLGALVDGALHIVGRLKDMIIVRGQNIYAEDIEDTVLSLPNTPGLLAAAAFAVERERDEALVIVVEIERGIAMSMDAAPLISVMKKAVAQIHGLVPHDIALCPPSAICRSSSGKLQRAATRRSYRDDTLPRWSSNPRTL